jgi:hypothetical protein
MKKNVGAYGINPRARTTSQRGDDESFAFNGQMGDGINRAANPYAKNQHSGHSNDGRLVQKGQMPNRTGNDGTCSHSGMAQSGKTPAVNAKSGMIDGGAVCKPFGNTDKINVGMGPRKGNQQ